MERTIDVRELRASLVETVQRVRRGERFTVLYRGRPAFRIVPIEQGLGEAMLPLAEDPMYRASGVGRSADALASRDHDHILYSARSPQTQGRRRG